METEVLYRFFTKSSWVPHRIPTESSNISHRFPTGSQQSLYEFFTCSPQSFHRFSTDFAQFHSLHSLHSLHRLFIKSPQSLHRLFTCSSKVLLQVPIESPQSPQILHRFSTGSFLVKKKAKAAGQLYSSHHQADPNEAWSMKQFLNMQLESRSTLPLTFNSKKMSGFYAKRNALQNASVSVSPSQSHLEAESSCS